MIFDQWAEKKGLNNFDLVDMLGTSYQNVMNWRNRKHSPRLVWCIKIRDLSKNRIKFEELLSYKDNKKLEELNEYKKRENRIIKKSERTNIR